MLRTKQDRQLRHIPRGIRLISTLYILGGILMLLTSICLVVMEYNSLIVENDGGGKGIIALFLFPILVGANLIGALLGLVKISTGVGLKKMKESALTHAYIFTGLWILLSFLIVLMFIPIIASLEDCIFSLIGVVIIGISIINGIYLYRVRHYFSDNPIPPQY
jgi:magnesium-transporting ATPase (P-type)